MRETKSRSIVKSITFRITAMAIGFAVAYVFTHRVDVSVGIILVRDGIMTLIYFFHERAWSTIEWGKKTGGRK